MRFQRLSNRQIVQLDTALEIGAGGEARVFALPGDDRLVAKVYRKSKPLYTRKLAIQLANPPDNPTAAQGHLSFAWPSDLLLAGGTAKGSKTQVAGFLMPRVTGMRPLIDFYNPKTRRTQCPLFNYLYLHRTARNLAAAVSALHARGYAIGDVNESNILLTDTALVTLVDIDSIQVRDPDTGEVYRCPVGKAEFTPPELQGQSFATLDRAPEHDLFGLAVLIFQLLMEGTHPFAGVYKLPGDPPPMEKRIAEGYFPYGRKRVPVTPMPVAPPFEILHPMLQELFIRCFEDGYLNPGVRPDARTWASALSNAEDSLVTCAKNDQHRYSSHLSRCPWCDRASALGGRDPFPSQEAVKRGQHLKPIPQKKIPVQPAPLFPMQRTVKAPATAAQVGLLAPTRARTPVAVSPGISSPSSFRRSSGEPLLEFSLPPVNPLLAGLFILGVALAGIVYGNAPPQLSPVSPTPQTEIQTNRIRVDLVQTISTAVPINSLVMSPNGQFFAANDGNARSHFAV
ncbi:MAG: hypothetical protein LRZ84_13415 [Desertifilum sp.]|nr:hypothetical protein [Desertifilum sp.]